MEKTVKQLACDIIGDGKKPNMWFVTIGYGWYYPRPENNECELPEMVQAPNSLDSVTILCSGETQAGRIYEAIDILPVPDIITGNTIGQVILEDRHGVVKEKALTQKYNGTWGILKF